MLPGKPLARLKVELMKERILAINPKAELLYIKNFIHRIMLKTLYILIRIIWLDAIDTVTARKLILS